LNSARNSLPSRKSLQERIKKPNPQPEAVKFDNVEYFAEMRKKAR